MSEHALTLFKGKVPAHIRNLGIDETTKSLMGSGGGKRISIKGGVFRKIVNGEEVMRNEDRAMNVVIIKSSPHVIRQYYEGTYVEGSTLPPNCWSADNEKPDPSVEEPMSKNCATCPMNEKGSGQGDSRACRFSRRLAVLLDGDLEGDVLQLSLPSQSIFGKGEADKMPLEQYARFLAGYQVPVTAVVTEMKFDTNSATPKLTFKAIRPLEEDEMDIVLEKAETQEAIDAITFSPASLDSTTAEDGEDEEQFEQEEKPKAPAKPKTRTKTKPAPEPEPDEDDSNEESDEEDDEEAELMRKLEEAKKRKAAKAAESAKAAEAAKSAKSAKSEPVDEEDEDDAPPPKVRKSRAKSDAAPTKQEKTAEEILAEWDDDEDDETDD